MNRKILILVGIFLTIPMWLSGQSNTPIIGYDRVAWGASIEEVRKHYPNIREVNIPDFFAHSNSLGVRSFIQSQVNIGGINSRKFYFFQDKLYRVDVNYGRGFIGEMLEKYNELEYSMGEALHNSLVFVYGRFDSEVDNSPGRGTRTFIRNYHRNLTIKLEIGVFSPPDTRFRMDSPRSGRPLGNVTASSGKFEIAIVFYENPTVIRQIEEERLRQQRNRIQL